MTDISAVLPKGSIGGKEIGEEQGKDAKVIFLWEVCWLLENFSRMPIPIEMDDYECIVTSLCLYACILLSA